MTQLSLFYEQAKKAWNQTRPPISISQFDTGKTQKACAIALNEPTPLTRAAAYFRETKDTYNMIQWLRVAEGIDINEMSDDAKKEMREDFQKICPLWFEVVSRRLAYLNGELDK